MEVLKPFHRNLKKYDSFVISMCIEGDCEVRVRQTGEVVLLRQGHSMLMPAAIADYDHAIALDRNLAEAYYNRGLVYIKTNHIEKGVADLSKAGEMGLYSAYSLIKKYNIEMKKKQN